MNRQYGGLKVFGRIVALPIFSLFLTACKPEVVANLYVADIYEAIETGEAIRAPISIRIPIQSVDECEESQKTILPILNSFSENAISFVHCEHISQEIFDVMVVETDIDILFIAPGSSISFSGLGAILVGAVSNHNLYEAYFTINANYQEMIDALDNAYPFQRVDGQNIDFSITISNDTRAMAQMQVGGLFINGEPVMRSRPFSLDRREELRIKSSDLAAAHLAQNRYVHFGYVAGEGAEFPESWQSVKGLFSETP